MTADKSVYFVENLNEAEIRRLARKDESDVPNLTSTASLSSFDSTKHKAPYEPSPSVSQSTILTIGFIIFVLAHIWPPLLLLIAYLASKLIPHSFRQNDGPIARRQLFKEFANEDDLPDRYETIPGTICSEESYWVNFIELC